MNELLQFFSSRDTSQRTKRKRRTGAALHEAQHAVAAILNGTEVLHASVRPGYDSDGDTWLATFDPVSAAAPHAHGGYGTRRDLEAIRLMGESVRKAIREARKTLKGHLEEVKAVAAELSKKEYLTGSRIKEIMEEVRLTPWMHKLFFPS